MVVYTDDKILDLRKELGVLVSEEITKQQISVEVLSYKTKLPRKVIRHIMSGSHAYTIEELLSLVDTLGLQLLTLNRVTTQLK